MTTERELFEACFKNLDFSHGFDTWGRPEYFHHEIQSLWTGWQARAAAPQTVQAEPQTATCNKCDTFGGTETYENQVQMPIEGKVICIDWCIHPIVAALNAAGIKTVACCCGHGKIPGRIDLADGRTLMINQSEKSVPTKDEL